VSASASPKASNFRSFLAGLGEPFCYSRPLMSKITRGKAKTSDAGEKLGPMKVVRQKAADRKRLPPDLEAFARSDDKRIRGRKPPKQLDDPRMVYLVTGVANRHARLVYDAHLARIQAALTAYREDDLQETGLAQHLAVAVGLGVWRGKSLTSFEAFAEGVLGMGEEEAKQLAVDGGADEALTRLPDTTVAVWMRVEAALLEEGIAGEVAISEDGTQIQVALELGKAPEGFTAISRLISPMAEPVQPKPFAERGRDRDDEISEEPALSAAAESSDEGADAFSVESNDNSDSDSDPDSDSDSDTDSDSDSDSDSDDAPKKSAWTKRDAPASAKRAFGGKLDDNAWTPPARKPARDFGDAPRGPRRDFGDKPSAPRRDFGDKPRGPRRDFGDKPSGPRRDFGGGGGAPRRDFGDKPSGPRRDFGGGSGAPRRDFGDAPRGPRRDFGDKPSGPRRDFGGGASAPRRDFGDAPRGPRRDFGGDKPSGPRRDFGAGGGAPRRDFGDAPRGPRRDFGDKPSGPRRDFGDAPRGPRRDFGGGAGAGAPRRDFGDKPRGPRANFGDAPRGPRRDFGGSGGGAGGAGGPRRDFGDKPRGPRREGGGPGGPPKRDFRGGSAGGGGGESRGRPPFGKPRGGKR
jgi:hypothetical protein